MFIKKDFQCKYKHPYPIGYRATKSHFGNDYTMGISQDTEGGPPVFTVCIGLRKEENKLIVFDFQVQLNQTTWKGHTPTAPWTEACIKSKSSSTRVSGPLVSVVHLHTHTNYSYPFSFMVFLTQSQCE